MNNQGSRLLMGYHFETGSMSVNVQGQVKTEDALAMLETLIDLKRRELSRSRPPGQTLGTDRKDAAVETENGF